MGERIGGLVGFYVLCKIEKSLNPEALAPSLAQRDRAHLWHPLTQHKTSPLMTALVRSEGIYLFDEEGNRYMDGISSWYTTVYGHRHPHIVGAMKHQLDQLDQVVFSGFTHEPAVLLSEKLAALLPVGQQKLFFSDNGSTAVEIGIKMALQYFHNQGQPKTVLMALNDGFHGDTFGAMSVSGLSVYNGPFEAHLMQVERIEVPRQDNIQGLIDHLEARLSDRPDVAGFIYEPLVQGAAAMQMHEAEHLDQILAVLRKHGVLLIADEVMTGFGKTGTLWASDQLQVKPDIMCLSKALTAGALPMAVTTCTQQIYDAFYSDHTAHGLFHGHTYTAHPLACAAAMAALDLAVDPEVVQRRKNIEVMQSAYAAKRAGHPQVAHIRAKGVIMALDLAVEIPRYGSFRDTMYRWFMDRGLSIRPLGATLYLMPPLITTAEELQQMHDLFDQFLDEIPQLM
jgi:adenosylmethionine-8-amino-7-oxononanoate aminotransferase